MMRPTFPDDEAHQLTGRRSPYGLTVGLITVSAWDEMRIQCRPVQITNLLRRRHQITERMILHPYPKGGRDHCGEYHWGFDDFAGSNGGHFFGGGGDRDHEYHVGFGDGTDAGNRFTQGDWGN
jgi:hypothetical protein